jgi:hypothetical protein
MVKAAAGASYDIIASLRPAVSLAKAIQAAGQRQSLLASRSDGCPGWHLHKLASV